MERTVLELLQSHRMIGGAPARELEWIAAHGALRKFPAGEIVSRQQEAVDGLYIVISGRLSIHINRPTGPRRVMEWCGGDVTGLLPYSRMVQPPGDTITDEPTVIVSIAREDVPALATHCYEVTSILVHEMTDRARWFTSSDLRDEKLTSLGKLAAGLAHELNNPASALIRDAKTLGALLLVAGDTARAIWDAELSREQLTALEETIGVTSGRSAQQSASGMELAEREDVFAAWMTAHGLDPRLADDLARTPIDDTSLNRLATSLQGPDLEAALRWFVATSSARVLVTNMQRAASRIHGLVASVKGFTHLGRGSEEGSIDVGAGLTDTRALLEGKARDRSVSVSLDVAPQLPAVEGYAAELNQVWMNLIDNAIDAAPPSGHVHVAAKHKGSEVIVSIADDGPGIPPEIAGKVFDPFFTTKDVGVGTGLGLDIVRRIVQAHGGEIDFSTRPGWTEFRVRLPLHGNR